VLYKDYATTYRDIDKEGITSILKNLEEEAPDITIAMLHWGSEYNETISETQEDIAALMKKGGVDVILGSHPHLLQTIVHDPLAGTLIAYSLGDFYGDGTRGGSNYSIILDMEITKDSDAGITRVTDFSYTPIYTLQINENQGDYKYSRVVRIREAMDAYNNNFVDKITKSAYESMEYAMKRIEERVATEKIVECPSCEEDLKILVNKFGLLVSQKTCKCGKVLEAGSKYSDIK
jgi:poly-gamma-glutamate synthesis protein (capsule biosynthesis protein)